MSSPVIPSSYIRDNYDIAGELGGGLFSVTYKVTGKKDGRNYAVKIYDLEQISRLLKHARTSKVEPIPVLKEMLNNNRRIMDLLRREPRARENIKEVYEVGTLEDPYVVSEYLDYNLKQYMARGMSPQDAIKIVLDVARGLRFVFTNTTCICHGDISPDNIFISKKGDEIVAKLGDFDGARFPEVSVPVSLFKLDYRPPEKDPDREGKYDVYSLGVILAEMILGEHGAKTIKNEGGEAVDKFPVSNELKNLIRRSAAFYPEKRFTLNEFIDTLKNALEIKATTPPPPPPQGLEKEVRDVASLYLKFLEDIRRSPDSNKFNRIKKDIDPRFDELVKLWKEKREESIPRIRELISYLRRELS